MISNQFSNSDLTDHVYPLEECPASLGGGGVALQGVLVSLCCLHVGEDVGRGLVEGGHLAPGWSVRLQHWELLTSEGVQ